MMYTPDEDQMQALKNETILSVFKSVAAAESDSRAVAFTESSQNSLSLGKNTVFFRGIIFSDIHFFYHQMKGDQSKFKSWLILVLEKKYDFKGRYYQS